jgi:hypothetical protein
MVETTSDGGDSLTLASVDNPWNATTASAPNPARAPPTYASARSTPGTPKAWMSSAPAPQMESVYPYASDSETRFASSRFRGSIVSRHGRTDGV